MTFILLVYAVKKNVKLNGTNISSTHFFGTWELSVGPPQRHLKHYLFGKFTGKIGATSRCVIGENPWTRLVYV